MTGSFIFFVTLSTSCHRRLFGWPRPPVNCNWLIPLKLEIPNDRISLPRQASSTILFVAPLKWKNDWACSRVPGHRHSSLILFWIHQKFPDIRPFASPVTCSKGNHSVTDCLSTNSRVSELEVSGTNWYHYWLT